MSNTICFHCFLPLMLLINAVHLLIQPWMDGPKQTCLKCQPQDSPSVSSFAGYSIQYPYISLTVQQNTVRMQDRLSGHGSIRALAFCYFLRGSELTPLSVLAGSASDCLSG